VGDDSPAHIVFAPIGPRSASTRERAFSWFDRLGVPFVDATVSCENTAKLDAVLRHPVRQTSRYLRALALAHRASGRTIMIQRELAAWSTGRAELAAISRARRSIYDLDDGIHLAGSGGAARSALFDEAKKVHRIARAVDVLVVGSHPLEEWASGLRGDVVRIPTCVDPSDVPVRSDYRLGGPPRLLWIGSISTAQELEPIVPALQEAHRRTGARLTMVGDPRSVVPAGLEAMAELVAWSPAAVHHHLAVADVGLMPLRSTPFNTFKCAYKLLQYGAAGLPLVGSPVGESSVILAATGNQAPARPEQWADAIVELLSSSDAERALLGRRTRQYVDDHYSFRAWSGTVTDLLLG
jgi:glycosyltransferase involved in cell wall biosynthesis